MGWLRAVALTVAAASCVSAPLSSTPAADPQTPATATAAPSPPPPTSLPTPVTTPTAASTPVTATLAAATLAAATTPPPLATLVPTTPGPPTAAPPSAAPTAAPVPSLRVLRTLTVGTIPNGIARDPVSRRFFVANAAGRTISVIDAAAEAVVATIAMTADPQQIVASAATARLYATTWSDTLAVIDPATNTVVSSTRLGQGLGSAGIALNERTGRIYAANFSADSVSVTDLSGRLLSTIVVGEGPLDVAVDPASSRVFVVHLNSGKLSVIDAATDRLIGTMTVGIQPRQLAVDSARGVTYIADQSAEFIAVIDALGTRVIRTIPVGGRAASVSVDARTGHLYVGTSQLIVIDPATGGILSRTEVAGQNLRRIFLGETSVLATYGATAGRVAVISRAP